jgi:hypothetical protein
MKRIVITCFALFWISLCYAQHDLKIISDSLAMASRAKADIILSKFDTIHHIKILYSLLDKDYYIIVQDSNSYKEYYISIDFSNNITSYREISIKDKYDSLRKQGVKSRKIIKHIENENATIQKAFDLSSYNTDLITYVPNAIYVAGVHSYFVVKDENNNRYGEYSLSSFTAPCPISTELWLYLLKCLGEQQKRCSDYSLPKTHGHGFN